MISLSLVEDKLRVLGSTDDEIDKLSRFPFRQAVYGPRGGFLHWEMPKREIKRILEQFDPIVIDWTDWETGKFVLDYNFNTQAIEDLPRERVGELKTTDGREAYPFQRDFVAIAHKKKALLNSFLQGLGKTATSLWRAREVGYTRLLIVSPKLVLTNWKTQVRDVLQIEPVIFGGTPAQRKKKLETIAEANTVVTNYEQLCHLPKDLAFDYLIIDEIHLACNPRTKIHKDLFEFIQKWEPKRVGLSGTPMRMFLKDLWGVLRLLDADFAGDIHTFLNEFEEELGFRVQYYKDHNGFRRTRQIPIKLGTKNEEKLRERLKSILVRVKRDDIVDFKDTIELITTPLTNIQRKMYDEIKEGILRDLSTGELKDGNNVLVRMLRLLQASEGAFNIEPSVGDSGKFDFVVEELEHADGKRIVWSRFVPITTRLQERFPDRGVVYNGETSDGLRQLGVWAFQGLDSDRDLDEFNRLRKYHPTFPFEPGEADFFFGTVNLRSGLGINLHRGCSHSIFTSFDWNPHANFQAKDRTARIGQTANEVITQILVSEDTLEAKAIRSILNNYKASLDILDGKASREYSQTTELIGLLRGL